jgi:hypothetical protein
MRANSCCSAPAITSFDQSQFPEPCDIIIPYTRAMRPPSVGILWALTATVGCAQTGTATRPAYDVASIRPNTTAGGDSSSRGTTGQIVFTNQPLKRLIERAYGVKPFQVAGPPWIENVRFDITARYPPETNIDDRALMLRALLEDRFGLAVHRESKLMPGYTLVVSKSGFKAEEPIRAAAAGLCKH